MINIAFFFIKSNNFFAKYLLKYLTIVFLLIDYIYVVNSFENKLIHISNPKKQIFTFWEPKDKIPGYLNLCIKTWKKYFPEYYINIMDFNSVKHFIGKHLFSKIISKSLTLPIQADAIRVALLNKNGGIWMDPDTIITNSNFIKKIENYELVMIGKNKMQHMGFIYTSNNSNIMKDWLHEIIRKVKIYNQLISKNISTTVKWDYLGNSIIDRILLNYTNKNFFRLDRNEISAFPESILFTNTTLDIKRRYIDFYFRNGEPKILLEKVKGIILLHNSWTPMKYKAMTEEEFLNEDILLSKFFKKILK